MPIYEYICNKCNKEFEKLILNNRPEIVCPRCESKNVRRKASLFGFKSSKGFTSSKSSSGCEGCTSSSCQSCGK